MIKKVLLCVALCCSLVVGMAFPAFATGDILPIDGIIIGSQTLSESAFSSSGDLYSVVFQSAGFKIDKVGLDCVVSYGDERILLQWWAYLGDLYEKAYCIGNPALLDADESGNGVPFVFVINTKDKSQCKFVCTSAFYAEHIIATGDDGFTITFAVPKDAGSSISDGVTGSLNFAGQVITALVSPDGALVGLLPVVGLSVALALIVWGIKRFKDCTWGF